MRMSMKNLIKALSTGAIAAVVTFFVLIFSGLGTTGLMDAEGKFVSMTTVNLGVNEFGLLMILVVMMTVVITSYALTAADQKKT